MLTVGAILREPVQTTLRFVSWYLAQGADRIVLCFDDPDDPAIDLLSSLDRVECIRCDVAFWRGIRVDPAARFTKRQNKAMRHVYRKVEQGWFLNVDADELVHVAGRSLREELDRQPPRTRSILIRPAEHIQTPDSPGAHHFRYPMKRWASRMVYGDLSTIMEGRAGLSGHMIGKSATRAGIAGLMMGQHFPKTRDDGQLTDCRLGHEEGVHLLHFFDQGFVRWREKIEWRLSARGYSDAFGAMLAEIVKCPDADSRLLTLYDRIHVFDAARLDQLAACRARLDLDIDPDALIMAQILGLPDAHKSAA